MFGGPLPLPKLQKVKPKPKQPDITMPSATKPKRHAHKARDPHTDFDKNMLHYKQREMELIDKVDSQRKKENHRQLCTIVHNEIAKNRRLQAKVKEKLDMKLAVHEMKIDSRREKLRDMLYLEEREFIQETIDKKQKADENTLDEQRKRCEQLKAAKEAERLQIVKEKRLQQFASNCLDLVTTVAQKNLMDTKACQLQQIRDNEMRREMERELDKMWGDVCKRQQEAFHERETHNALIRFEKQHRDKDILDMQIKAKKMMEEERKEIDRLNREETLILCEKLKLQEEQDLKEKRLKSVERAKDLRKQLQLQQEFAAKRRKEEHALDQALKYLTDLEVQKENAKFVDNRDRMKIETAMYRKHLEELEARRREEDRQFEILVDKCRMEDQKIQNERQCKVIEAKRKLRDSVMKERAQQLVDKKAKIEKDLLQKEEENKILQQILDTNLQLDIEAKRLEAMAIKEYRCDLRKQIEYNNLLREREIKVLEEEIRKGVEEEEYYKSMARELMGIQNIKQIQGSHPFREVLEQFDCHCKENDKK